METGKAKIYGNPCFGSDEGHKHIFYLRTFTFLDKFVGGVGKGIFMGMMKNRAWAVKAFIAASLVVAAPSLAKVDYVLHKAESPTEDQLDAYNRITAVMDSAIHYYNTYTNLTKHINVYYAPGVPTAEASSNGDLRFGENRTYMYVGTAMHEMAHTMGIGTTSEYQNLKGSGVFLGEKAQALLKELDNNPSAELHCDGQHFWPYGLNQKSEVKSEDDLIKHAKIVQAMYQDMFKEAFYMDARVEYLAEGKCMGITSTNAIEMMDCSAEGTAVKVWSVGEDPVTYRFEFGDRVLDVPNESTAAGVVLGTYGWNGGAHQKYIFEATPVNTENAFYLQNFKSKLYLLPDGKNVVQDQRGRFLESGIWVLRPVNSSLPAEEGSSSSAEAVSSSSSVADGTESSSSGVIVSSSSAEIVSSSSIGTSSSGQNNQTQESSSSVGVEDSEGVVADSTQSIRRKVRPAQVDRGLRLVDVKGRAVRFLKSLPRKIFYNN